MRQQIGRWFLTGAAALFMSVAGAQPAPERLATCAVCHGADGNSAAPGIPSLAGQPKVFLENYLVLTREGVRGSEVMQRVMHGMTDREIVALAAHFNGLQAMPLPGNTDPALYKRGREVARNNRCGNCHTPSYRGQSQMPRLAGQREEFLLETMFAYRENSRPGGDTMMAAALYGIPDADIRAVAHFLARTK